MYEREETLLNKIKQPDKELNEEMHLKGVVYSKERYKGMYK